MWVGGRVLAFLAAFASFLAGVSLGRVRGAESVAPLVRGPGSVSMHALHPLGLRGGTNAARLAYCRR